jgi:enoyl-CoA hydratase/carnithine racemase
MSEQILLHVADGISQIRINRPDKKNALNLAMYTAMSDALERGEADPAVRVHFFTGTDDCFTSGNDILDFMQAPPQDDNHPVIRFISMLPKITKPMVAAVNGAAVGVGTTLLLHCDLVYAGANAKFRMPFVNLGVCPEAGSSYLLPQIMGHQRAAELLMLGEVFSAAKAKEVGIVNDVFADGETQAKALEKAAQLAAQAPKALLITKSLLKRGSQAALLDAMAVEGGHFIQLLGGGEAMEAMTAFMQRRKPDFSKVG